MTAEPDTDAGLEDDLVYLGLLDKAHEIYAELGTRAAVSYIKSSYRFLSKVYHPDLNPSNRKALMTQRVLGGVRDKVSRMTDDELAEVIKKGVEGRTAKKKILLVEDEPALQRSLRLVLTMEGYDCRIAVNGVQGYEEYRRFAPHLVLCDIVMPEMNGEELVAKIRKLKPKVKVIYISGFLDITSLDGRIDQEVLRYGYRTLAKPFKPSTVLSLISDYLNSDAGEYAGVDVVA